MNMNGYLKKYLVNNFISSFPGPTIFLNAWDIYMSYDQSLRYYSLSKMSPDVLFHESGT